MDITLALASASQTVEVSATKLLRTVWGADHGNEPDYLRTYVRTLRKKIEDDPGRPAYILTEPWVGYRLRDPQDPDSAWMVRMRDLDDDEDDF